MGKENLHYTEAEIFRMTLRKFYLIYDEYLDYHGYKKDDESMLDAL